MSLRTIQCAAAVMLLAGLHPGARAEGSFPSQPGTWKLFVSKDPDHAYRLTDAQRKTLTAKMQVIVSLLRATPVLSSPRGFRAECDVDFCCAFYCERDKTCTSCPALGRIWLRLNYFFKGRHGQPATDGELRTEAELSFNNPYTLWTGGPQLKLPDGRAMAWQPTVWRQVNGVTVHRQGRPRFIFLTRAPRPLWLKVTREQYLSALLRSREAELKVDVPLPPEARARLDEARKLLVDPVRVKLRELTAAEKASQAWVGDPGHPVPLVAAGAPGARAVVVHNPDYFDRSRPRTEVQLITVKLIGVPDEEEKVSPTEGLAVGQARLWELVNQVDWKKVAAVMH